MSFLVPDTQLIFLRYFRKGEKNMAQLKTGDQAPDFGLQNQNGKKVKLTDFKGRKLLLYFYPKANTSG